MCICRRLSLEAPFRIEDTEPPSRLPCSGTGKRRIAFVTLEWFQSHVHVHMASQALPAAKILSTHIAGTPFPVGHLYVLVVLHLKWYVIMLFDAMVYPDIDQTNPDKSRR